MRPIAIIGAGIAGLSCAVRLREAGVPVEVIEKSRSPGGRAGTCGGDGWQCDHGAQYFTARDPDFVAEVERWLETGVVATWTPRLAVFDGTRMHPRISDEKRFVARPRMSTLGRHLAAGLSLRENTRVTALAHDVEDWLLDTEEHGRLEPYSGVVVTVPAPQASAMLASVASELAQVAADAPMHGCWALIARFDNDPRLDFDAAFVNHGALSWVARDSSKPDRPDGHTWLLHAPVEGDLGGESEVELARIATSMLRAFGDLGAPPPDDWVLHRWRFAHSPDAPVIGAQWDADARIGLAGDWLMGGRIEGAWLSGRKLAEHILAG
ncbi:NAD(P)/FAD-dependent oxidoreductase [Pseudazoarcus pumilus]|uniref:NAD(P)/FAD-dependent oxidoreductase n=1 Tax=Pseudazoarcus pumilus TaxID=2067960 RepID=UPI001D17591B|nr:FAD-dependent oxidoreductase [Pseudazoarcus pumilus]